MQQYRVMALAVAIPAVLAMPLAQAAEREPGFDGSASMGYVGTSGNTDTQTFDTQIRMTLRTESGWVHGGRFQALFSEQDSQTSGERYMLENKSDYRLGDRGYVFGQANYTDDRFTGFDYQASVATGYGHYLFNTDEQLLELYAGAGYRYNAYRDASDEGEVILSLGQNLEWALGGSTTLEQSLRSEIGDELTVSRFEVALVSNIIGQLSTKIAFQARHISDVPVGRKKTDTQTSISLVYDF